MSLTLNDLIRLYDDRGNAWCSGEPVTQRQHALQCAWLAERDGATPGLVVACLLHDVGHLLHDLGDNAAERGLDDAHEFRAAQELSNLFPPAVLSPIRLHVTAKRYLCANDPGYRESLSTGSRQSLDVQGGPLPSGQCAAFMSVPWAEDAIRLRRYDDAARVREAATPDLEHFRPMLRRLAFSNGHRMAMASLH